MKLKHGTPSGRHVLSPGGGHALNRDGVAGADDAVANGDRARGVPGWYHTVEDTVKLKRRNGTRGNPGGGAAWVGMRNSSQRETPQDPFGVMQSLCGSHEEPVW